MGTSVALLLAGLIGLCLGLYAGLWAGRTKTQTQQLLREQSERASRDQCSSLQLEVARLREEGAARSTHSSHLAAGLATQTTLAQERLTSLTDLEQQGDALRQQLQAALQTEKRQAEHVAQLRTELQKEREIAAEKLKLLTNARVELTHQFEALAGKILDEKSSKFTEQNKVNLDQLLNPLRVQINDFRGKVEEAQKDSNAGRVELRGKLESLEKLNQQLSSEAHNLSTALRGSSKAQGDWGEFILRDLLEKAGLRRGEQYSFQETFPSVLEENGVRGKASRTDVVINLPGGRHLVVDSKVSLNAYTDHCNALTEELRKSALKQHIASVRAHLDNLSRQNYHKLPRLDSPDFVVMFIPIEPAFLVTMQESGDLWREAYERNVLLVGPTTLLFVIRIVDNLWQQEQQARSVADIVNRGTKLYEKFVNFVSDLEEVGAALSKANKSYDGAMNKLSTGSGNLVGQVEKLKKSGIRTTKQLSPRLLDLAGIDEDELALVADLSSTPAGALN